MNIDTAGRLVVIMDEQEVVKRGRTLHYLYTPELHWIYGDSYHERFVVWSGHPWRVDIDDVPYHTDVFLDSARAYVNERLSTLFPEGGDWVDDSFRGDYYYPSNDGG